MIRYKLIIYSNINDHVYTRNNSYTCPSTVSLSQRVHMPILEYHLAFFLWKVTQSLLEGTLLYCDLFDFFLTFYLGSLSYPESLYSGTLKDVNLLIFFDWTHVVFHYHHWNSYYCDHHHSLQKLIPLKTCILHSVKA